ncbi:MULTISPECIES: carbamoyl phosphate synthase small subunit [Caproicibacterium]|uniref:Carbamoyl phosphate synthase small chain n=1 Tax=Caproicibacterium lactatifermentans TaxID=2666138 RepID=A0A859DV12_9FIRM|nr:carbamoyl phosphate synthase small subunit [Caproicibacterium lactatifermentans]ARP51266.1 carbamoyl phosphate synthase small subunit [Ruminococcaceae bacterium CPB6]QKN24153.1 carbamoyl phosphate synthase small subunit [Caproicibacterium lactatifermentans]QKO31219.1 carbamoyl phosphate synthase small subunit [Caproicibacterium lactatifermentans]
MKGLLMLENGATFAGTGFGDEHDILCEVVFNSAMCGYPELLTDPSYAGQGVVMTYPMIGNYGICYEDAESAKPWLRAYIVRSVSNVASNFRCDIDLNSYLTAHHVPGLQGIDTRALTRILRESGTMRGMIAYADRLEDIDQQAMKQKIAAYRLESCVPQVSVRGGNVYGDGAVKVALMDYGVKSNIIRSLVAHGCTVKCFPWDAAFEQVMEWKPDGIMLSNGPGDPKECKKAIAELKKVYAADVPTFAICLGHQLMALAQGFDTYKLKYGHRGINHPVKDLATNRVYITSQNHGYVVDEKTVDPAVASISFVSMNDGSIEGLRYKNGRCFSVQFHPEACGGPRDTAFLFDRFMKVLGGERL